MKPDGLFLMLLLGCVTLCVFVCVCMKMWYVRQSVSLNARSQWASRPCRVCRFSYVRKHLYLCSWFSGDVNVKTSGGYEQ